MNFYSVGCSANYLEIRGFYSIITGEMARNEQKNKKNMIQTNSQNRKTDRKEKRKKVCKFTQQ